MGFSVYRRSTLLFTRFVKYTHIPTRPLHPHSPFVYCSRGMRCFFMVLFFLQNNRFFVCVCVCVCARARACMCERAYAEEVGRARERESERASTRRSAPPPPPASYEYSKYMPAHQRLAHTCFASRQTRRQHYPGMDTLHSTHSNYPPTPWPPP